ncbi:helix-turn-helix domain-containing protein [Coraliomargarita akajimensis]|uniref:Transcriptional regulator, AraC family n=1 Tax=Coraliomargarita akajimensis (strain DSM 45221 / IAM 15411 / JCM 23193 / KCTC 12865 / 04OKA010-24) TaxID=583355 RepID=D5ENR8_CORAD|nr:AraC family transcriptional regulator [Coraliomargarita akajimensis]ADE53577.1 transcriptional regulator, AraC family [Coraliomargarita akajimensis DSM 45221]
MFDPTDKRLYPPRKDRAHWQPDPGAGLPLMYLAWGRRDFSEEFLPECRHEGWVCTIIEEGNPVMVIQGVEVTLEPRQLVLIGPDCSFGWPSKEGSTCKFVQWMWQGPSGPDLAGISMDGFIISKLPRGKYQPLRDNHNQCRREVQMLGHDKLSHNYLDACYRMFAILLERVLALSDSSDSAEERVKLAQEWMRQHLESKEPVARLCDYLDISQSTLHRLFKAQIGQSPVEYFHGLRMTHARKLLRKKSVQIKEVALILGYVHINDFSRAFKSYYGFPPSKRA